MVHRMRLLTSDAIWKTLWDPVHMKCSVSPVVTVLALAEASSNPAVQGTCTVAVATPSAHRRVMQRRAEDMCEVVVSTVVAGVLV